MQPQHQANMELLEEIDIDPFLLDNINGFIFDNYTIESSLNSNRYNVISDRSLNCETISKIEQTQHVAEAVIYRDANKSDYQSNIISCEIQSSFFFLQYLSATLNYFFLVYMYGLNSICFTLIATYESKEQYCPRIESSPEKDKPACLYKLYEEKCSQTVTPSVCAVLIKKHSCQIGKQPIDDSIFLNKAASTAVKDNSVECCSRDSLPVTSIAQGGEKSASGYMIMRAKKRRKRTKFTQEQVELARSFFSNILYLDDSLFKQYASLFFF
jgi:hypothetical protein